MTHTANDLRQSVYYVNYQAFTTRQLLDMIVHESIELRSGSWRWHVPPTLADSYTRNKKFYIAILEQVIIDRTERKIEAE